MKSKSLNFRKRALKVIPGGNSLLSKRPEMFSPEKWPGYFKFSKGIEVIDLDDKVYVDFSHFSVGTCSLGYNNEEINKDVINCINKGTMSTLNSFEEVLLAEKITKLHPWSSMVRFARTGGEANSISIRIARAYTQKEKILYCGYHGWHDWYLSANLKNENKLDSQLLPGLNISGVPSSLKNTVETFNYGEIEKIENELKSNQFAALKMEVMRNIRPSKEYLNKISQLCKKHKVLLILDECTSGFRETFGGLHLKYGIKPDLCVLGKTIANGFPLTCVLGTSDVMKKTSDLFISSTFWTERIGFVAALSTLKLMERNKSWEIITKSGTYYKKILTKIFNELKLQYTWNGMPALIGYEIKNCNWPAIKTKITEEMLLRGYLHASLFYPSILHSKIEIEKFAINLREVLYDIKLTGFKKIEFEMKNKTCHNTLKRMN